MNFTCQQYLYLFEENYEYIIVMVSTDDLFLSLYDMLTFNNLISHMLKFFPCISKKGPVIKIIKLCMVQPKYDIPFIWIENVKFWIDYVPLTDSVRKLSFNHFYSTFPCIPAQPYGL